MKHYGILSMIVFAVVLLTVSTQAGAHCEIPCGIYGDEARIEMVVEHIGTIEKSMNKIIELGRKQPINYNQLVRWVSNKEHHADEIQDIVTQYFMTQRIKLNTAKYQDKLGLLHKMLVYAMKCKQTTDLSHIATLRETVDAFKVLYFTGNK